MDERSTVIKIGGQEFTLVLTTRATKEIAKRYGGLEHLGEKLMKSENFEMTLDEVCWLITLLANQSVLIHNFQHPDDKRELLTEEMLELLTTPTDLSLYQSAIMEAMYKGTKRNVESEADIATGIRFWPPCRVGAMVHGPLSQALFHRSTCSCLAFDRWAKRTFDKLRDQQQPHKAKPVPKHER